MAAHMNFTPAAQVRSTSILSPDRRGGRLTGPGLPVVGTSAWVSAAPSPGLARPVSPPAVSYEPVPVARDGHHSPPPFAQQLQGPLAQQAYMALGQGAEVPATARPQWRDPSGRAAQAPTPQRSAVSAQSLHAPATGSGPLGLGMSPTGARGCSAVVSLGGRPSVPSAPEEGATARFSAPPCQLALGSQGSVQPARVTTECRRQHSVGGLSGASLPSGSPCTATREPKASIEVPCMVASRTEHDSENVKQVVRDAIRGVDDKVTDTNDKVTDTNDKVTDIHAILKSQRGEAQQARQEAQQAREAERQAREEEQLARVEALEAQAQLEEAQRRARQLEEAQRRLEEQLRQAEAARAEGERAGLAQAQQQEQEQQAERQRGRQQAEQQAEALQARLRAAEEEAGQLRVRQRALEAQIDERTSENCELRKQAEQLQGRLAAEGAARAQERQAAEDLGAARRQAEAEVRQAREQVEAELRAPRERLAERERAVEERQRALAAQEARAAQREEALAAQALELEERGAAEGQGAQLELQQLRERSQELERQVQQGRGHKQVVQEQKQTLWSVQSLLHREQSLANFLTPGELQRMMRREGAELAGGPEASELVLRHQGLETEVRELRWHNELLRKNLPRSTWESVARELTRVLPPSEPDAEPSA